MDVRAEARCGEVARCGQAAPDLASAGVLTYRLELRCGVVFPKLSKLLNQENALSAPCLKHFRNYRAPIKVARCGFPWEKTTKRPVASVYTHCESAYGDSCCPQAAHAGARMLPTGVIRHF